MLGKSLLACCRCLTKKSEWRLISKFPLLLEYRLQNLQPTWKQAPVPEEMSLTLLTNKKQGKITKHTLLTLLSQASFAFTGRNLFILKENLRSPLKNFKTSRESYLGLDLSTHVNKSPIYLVTQSL
jgi:hypothetical protein